MSRGAEFGMLLEKPSQSSPSGFSFSFAAFGDTRIKKIYSPQEKWICIPFSI
jgi:hypothetical protein